MPRFIDLKNVGPRSHKGGSVTGSKKNNSAHSVNERGRSGPPVSKPPGHKK